MGAKRKTKQYVILAAFWRASLGELELMDSIEGCNIPSLSPHECAYFS